jgi:hypothetical protein
MPTQTVYIQTGKGIQKTIGFPATFSISVPIKFKRGDNTTLKVGFLDTDGTLSTFGPGADQSEADACFVMCGMKEDGIYDTETFVASGSVTAIGADDLYAININLNTTALDALLFKNASTSDDLASVTLMFEITWSISGGGAAATDWESSERINALVENDVIRTSEAEATAAARGMLWQWGFDPYTKLTTSAFVLVDQASEPTPASGYALQFVSVEHTTSTLTIAKLNSLVNGKVAYGLGQPVDPTNITDAPTVNGSFISAHCWWDGSLWQLHVFNGYAWVAAWTSSDAVASADLVTTWTADTASYPSMTDDLASVAVSAAAPNILIPANWTQHGRQIELLQRDASGDDITLEREDATFTINSASTMVAAAGTAERLVLNAEATTPDWVRVV